MKEEFDILFAEHQKLLGELQAMRAVAKPKPEQEPVAYVHGDDLDNLIDDRVAFIQRTKSGHRKTALYTTPPQRKPFNHYEFGYWWFEYGSGLHPLEGEDQEEHAYRVATAAWQAAHNIKE